VGNGCVAASLACLALVVHDLAPTRTTGSALVQVAIPSHTDEREVAATRRTFHIWREQVKPHGRRWHLSSLRRGLLAACWAALRTEVARKVDRRWMTGGRSPHVWQERAMSRDWKQVGSLWRIISLSASLPSSPAPSLHVRDRATLSTLNVIHDRLQPRSRIAPHPTGRRSPRRPATGVPPNASGAYLAASSSSPTAFGSKVFRSSVTPYQTHS
jgi:hypothetical protein